MFTCETKQERYRHLNKHKKEHSSGSFGSRYFVLMVVDVSGAEVVVNWTLSIHEQYKSLFMFLFLFGFDFVSQLSF